MGTNRAWWAAVAAVVAGCGGAAARGTSPQTVQVESAQPSGSPTGEPSGTPEQLGAQRVASEFWVRLGRRDYAGAVALASYPFDLDAHPGCVASSQELDQAFASKPLPPDKQLVVGRARMLDAQGTGLGPMWAAKLRRFSASDAPCVDADAAAAGEYAYYLVEFTVDGEPLGALTRVRCSAGACSVAGVDN